ncbi:hypothetical protein EsH8_IX_000055 [Colletotrichum jinshuiense]
MCVTDVVHHICVLCNTRLGKPRRRIIERCPAADGPPASPHCGVLRDTVPGPCPADPALHPSGLEFEVLKTAPAYSLIEPRHRRPKPRMIRCELCVDHLGEPEAEARARWWREETRALVGKDKRLTPGMSTAGWSDVLR